MKMKQQPRQLLPVLLTLGLLPACNPDVHTAPSGIQYVIYHSARTAGPVSGSGSTVKLTLVLTKGDSVIRPALKMPEYKELIPGLVFPYSPIEVLYNKVRQGDSVIAWQRVDSLLSKRMLQKLPRGWKKSDRLVATMKILRVFPFDFRKSDSLVQVDKENEMRRLFPIEQKEGLNQVKHYLDSLHIKAAASPEGTFIQLITKGSGPLPDSNQTVSIQYTCSTLSGRVLDSNTDTSFHHPPLLTFRLGSRMIPPYIDKSLQQLHEGSHVKIYFPEISAMTIQAAIHAGTIPDQDFVWDIVLEAGKKNHAVPLALGSKNAHKPAVRRSGKL